MIGRIVIALCVSALFVQNAQSQCYGKAALPLAGPGLGAPYAPLGYNAGCGCGAAYGGSGVGNLAVAGELPVAGTTVVSGQVPIIGAVEFGGPAAAAGLVSITGACGCGCGCGTPYIY